MKRRRAWRTPLRRSAYFSSLACRGDRYVKEVANRVRVTWDVTEPYGNIQDSTWTKTIIRFQAVLHKDGAIEMSYGELAAQDAIIGGLPACLGRVDKPLATLPASKHDAVARHFSDPEARSRRRLVPQGHVRNGR